MSTLSIPPTMYNPLPANTECQRGLNCPHPSFLSAKSPRYCWKRYRHSSRKHISPINAVHKGGFSPPSARQEGNVLSVSWHGLAPGGAKDWRKVQLRQGASGTDEQLGCWKCGCSQIKQAVKVNGKWERGAEDSNFEGIISSNVFTSQF